MEAKHLVITCTLTVNNQVRHTHALIGCRAKGIACINRYYARYQRIPPQELKERRQDAVRHRSPMQSGDITYIAKVGMKIQDHKEQLPMFVTQFRYYPIVCGIQWL
jgi:hypothetical protein